MHALPLQLSPACLSLLLLLLLVLVLLLAPPPALPLQLHMPCPPRHAQRGRALLLPLAPLPLIAPVR